jgi:putative transposase
MHQQERVVPLAIHLEQCLPLPTRGQAERSNRRLFLPKLGWLRYRKSREVLGTVKNVTGSLSCGKWYISLQTEREVEPPLAQGDVVGIDMRIKRFFTLSNGKFRAPRNSFKRHETALRKAQQAPSRKVRLSRNGQQANARVQRLHARIANVRRG